MHSKYFLPLGFHCVAGQSSAQNCLAEPAWSRGDSCVQSQTFWGNKHPELEPTRGNILNILLLAKKGLSQFSKMSLYLIKKKKKHTKHWIALCLFS